MKANPICIYHANCADGFTAAWAVWKAIPEAEFHKGFYGESPPDVKDRDVIIVDFSYKRNALIEMAKQAKSILILDHHKSAEAELQNLPSNVEAHFDMNRSGAMMAWEHFHPNKAPSDLVIHVQDRDLWLFKRPQTKAFQANLFSYEYTFENWEMINNLCADDNKYHEFVMAGLAIKRKHEKDVRELIKSAAYMGELFGYRVLFLNCPYFHSSEAGHIMAKGMDFAVCYYDNGEERVFSLRSDENGADVSLIAAQFGGGGHKHAAGFRTPSPKAINDKIKHQLIWCREFIEAEAACFKESHSNAFGEFDCTQDQAQYEIEMQNVKEIDELLTQLSELI